MAVRYEDTHVIGKFAGINQSGDGFNSDIKYAQDGRNFKTELGDLTAWHTDKLLDDGVTFSETPGLTLAFLTKRWRYSLTGTDNITNTDSYNNAYAIMVCDNKLYWKRKRDNSFEGQPWSIIDGIEFSMSRFDTLTYEINYAPPVSFVDVRESARSGKTYYAFDIDDYDYHEVIIEADKAYYVKRNDDRVDVTDSTQVREAFDAAVDCLLMTNSVDGMYCVYIPIGSEIPECVHIETKPADTTIESRFGCIERYCERIFGSGITSDPDKIMYCAPYDPFNWEQNNIEPDDGAGDIQQPNWDGDKFISLKEFSTSLLCIKQKAVWKITGTTPSEFQFKKQFGDGTIADGSVATHGYYTYLLSDFGIKSFDGTGTSYLKYGALETLMREVPLDETALAERWGDYYVLLVGDDLIMYNTVESTFNVCDGHDITALKEYKGKLYALKTIQGKSCLVSLFDGEYGREVTWESAWIDLNAKNIIKSGFEVYLLIDTDDLKQHPINIEVAIASEKKEKRKSVNMYTNKPKRVMVHTNGRAFKVKLKLPSMKLDWHMRAGMQIYVEYDYD